MASLMIYGASGYTGRLTCEEARSLGLDLIVGGRSATKLASLGASLGVPYRVFGLDNPSAVDSAFSGIGVLLNCAGPFHQTAEPLMDACIRNGIHYLDISAELDTYILAEHKSDEAKRANVMLLPGCGGSVTMLGCLAGYAIEANADLAKPQSIDVAMQITGTVSLGSAISAAGSMSGQCLKRWEGKLVEQDSAATRSFDFGDESGMVNCFPNTLPDLVTIAKATKVDNIRAHVHIAGATFPTGDLQNLPDGPTSEEREASPYKAVVQITTIDGVMRSTVLHTVNGYTFTALASVHGAKQILAGTNRPGFQTPDEIFGHDFVKTIRGTKVLDGFS